MKSSNNRTKRWLITGSTGKLGKHVKRHAEKYAEVIETSREGGFGSTKFDLTDTDQIHDFLSLTNPSHILHLAAVARPSDVEESPEYAYRVNVEATEKIASWCGQNSCFLTFTSTDHVFSGVGAPYSELNAPSPITSYGRMKADAEAKVIECGGYVARLGWVIENRALDDPGFVGNALASLARGEQVFATSEELRTPIYASLAARHICRFTNANYRGVLHLAGDEHLTPFDLVDRLRKQHKIASGHLTASRRYPQPYCSARPADVRLDTSLIKKLLNENSFDWDSDGQD